MGACSLHFNNVNFRLCCFSKYKAHSFEKQSVLIYSLFAYQQNCKLVSLLFSFGGFHFHICQHTSNSHWTGRTVLGGSCRLGHIWVQSGLQEVFHSIRRQPAALSDTSTYQLFKQNNRYIYGI